MCFYIHQQHRKIKISEEDIICYKILSYRNRRRKSGVFISPHRGFIYDFNVKTLYEVSKFTRGKGFRFIKKNEIYNGLHSYTELEFAKARAKYMSSDVFQCIIPKGTKYLYNPRTKEYVSLKLEFKERLTFNGKRK